MARIRAVHPGQWTDEAFVQCSPWARLLAIGLRNEADDVGLFEWKPLRLKMRLFPADTVDVDALLRELCAQNIVCRYSVDGREYGAVRNFCRYQRPRKPIQCCPATPEVLAYVAHSGVSDAADGVPSDAGTEPVRNQYGTEGALSDAGTVPVRYRYGTEGALSGVGTELSPQKESGNKESGNKESGKKDSIAHRVAEPGGFGEFWTRYPRKVSKAAALKAWVAATKRAEPAVILAGLAAQLPELAARDPQYVPHASTWLNGDRWQDPPDCAGTGPPRQRRGIIEGLRRQLEELGESDGAVFGSHGVEADYGAAAGDATPLRLVVG